MRLRPLLALPAIVGLHGADDAVTLWRDQRWRFDWDERLVAQDDIALFPGFGARPRRVAPGGWGALEIEALAAGQSRPAFAPGMAPTFHGGEGRALAEADVAISHVFLTLRPEALASLSGRRQDVPNGDARGAWTGADPGHRYSVVSVAPQGTIGVWGLDHVLAASNEPVDWGEGAFGGGVLGRAWRGFPHLVLAPIDAWTLGEEGDFAVDYQAIGGLLDDARPTPDDPWLVGYRLAARWRWLTLAGALAAQGGGGAGGDGTRLLSPFGTEHPQDAHGNRMMSFDVRLAPLHALALYGEYAIDDDGDSRRWPLHPHGGGYLAGLDWLDLAGDQAWRLVVEWSRAESSYGYHPTWPWDYRDQSLGYPEGGNSAAARIMLQHQDEDGGLTALILGWQRLGWRNAVSRNAVGTQAPQLQQPAGPLLAPSDWQIWSATLHVEWPFSERSALLIDLAGYYDVGRRFETGVDRIDGAAGAGWRWSW